MNSERLARDYLKRAQDRIVAVEVLFQREAYPDVLREAQEVVELCLKGALRFLGIDPPKKYEVSGLLRIHIELLPAKWKENIEAIQMISTQLFEERSHAFYGDEADLIPASEIFGKEDAEEALNGAKMILDFFSDLLA